MTRPESVAFLDRSVPSGTHVCAFVSGPDRAMEVPREQGGGWTLLTGHGHVLVEIARNLDVRIRDISPVVGLTERAVQAIGSSRGRDTRPGRRPRAHVPTAGRQQQSHWIAQPGDT